jgi:hypothetical protein
MNTEGIGIPLEFDSRNVSRDAAVTTVVRSDMPESVLDGRLGELCHKRMRAFPLAYSWGSLVAAAGSLIPRTNSAIRTNLYWCPVGPPGSGKSQCLETSFRLLGMDQGSVVVNGKFGSAEALIERLGDIGPDGVRLIFVDELAHLMSKAAIERSSFPSILNTGFYHDQQVGGSKGRQFTFDCRLSIAGGVVEEQFGEVFCGVTTGGLYDRFIFGLCPQPYQFLYRPFDGEGVPLNPFAASVSSEVWDARDQWVKKEGIASRVAELALRVAYICCCVDGRPALRVEDLKPALAFAQYQSRLRKLLSPNPGENPDARCAIKIRNWLSENASGGKWVYRRDLDKGINSYRFGPVVFNRCLNNLAFNDEIELGPKGALLRLKGEIDV